MKFYCNNNTQCRRFVLFSEMEGYCPDKHSVPPKDCLEVHKQQATSKILFGGTQTTSNKQTVLHMWTYMYIITHIV